MKTVTKEDLAGFGEETRLVLSGRDPGAQHGFVNPPVYHGSTILFPDVATMLGGRQRYTYGRRGSPTIDAFSAAMTDLEGGDGVVLCPSGLSAVTTALLSCLSAGDHLLMTDSCYWPARHACNGLLARLGIETTYYDPLVGAGIEALIRPNTRVVYLESPGSLTFEVQDVPAIAAAAHRHGATVILDNTWATGLFFEAHRHGVDISLQAGTKYIVGHSDVLIGTVSATGDAWTRLKACHGDLGLCVGPDDLYLAMRGLRTLSVRLRQHQDNALAVARWLKSRPEVVRVMHPALEDDPGHSLWTRDFRGSSGLFSVALAPGGQAAVAAFLDGLKLFGLGYSWGGFESLAIPFQASTARSATVPDAGGPTVRFHIGLETVGDLVADLAAGLDRYRAALAV